MAERLMEFLPEDESFESILDIGSATGRVASTLSQRFQEGRVYACDISKAMLLRAREKAIESNAGRLYFVVSDFEALCFKDASIDLAASNLTYQWAASIVDAFGEAYRVLAPGGLLLMNTLTSGTLGELKESFEEAQLLLNRPDKRPFMDFVEPSILKASIEDSGLEVASFNEYAYSREYSSMRELLRVLKNIGANNPFSSGQTRATTTSLLKAAQEYYRSRFPAEEGGPEGVRATYNTVFISARKPE